MAERHSTGELFFVINPAARTFSPKAEGVIRGRFPDATILFTQCPGDATRLAFEALRAAKTASPIIVPCGGDGTFREAAQAVGGRARLSIGPLGTVNQIGAQLGIRTISDTLDALEGGDETFVFPGLARFDEETAWRMFFIGVSAGPDADAVGLVNPRLKKAAGGVAYAAAFFQRIASSVSPVIECEVEEEGGTERFRVSQAIALANGLYGGKFKFSGDFGPSDQRVELALSAGGRLGVTSFFLSSMLPGQRSGKTRKIAGGRITLTLPEAGAFQIDGDAERARRVEIRPSPDPVVILTPRKHKGQ